MQSAVPVGGEITAVGRLPEEYENVFTYTTSPDQLLSPLVALYET